MPSNHFTLPVIKNRELSVIRQQSKIKNIGLQNFLACFFAFGRKNACFVRLDTPARQMQVDLPLPSFIRTLAVPKILRLGKNASELALFSRLIRIFDLVLDTPARQCSNKFDIALAYSYL